MIEARDLVGRDLSGVSDPKVFVEAFGRKESTTGKKRSKDARFDETLFFEWKDPSDEDLNESQIKVRVVDMDSYTCNDLIGMYEFSALDVYYSRDHEQRRQWVALTAPFKDRDCHLTPLGLIGWTEKGGVQVKHQTCEHARRCPGAASS